jgi:hypothetical protein
MQTFQSVPTAQIRGCIRERVQELEAERLAVILIVCRRISHLLFEPGTSFATKGPGNLRQLAFWLAVAIERMVSTIRIYGEYVFEWLTIHVSRTGRITIRRNCFSLSLRTEICSMASIPAWRRLDNHVCLVGPTAKYLNPW